MESILTGQTAQGKVFSWSLMRRRLRGWMRDFLNAALLESREEYLKARSHERTASRRDWRNGYRSRNLSTAYGEVRLRVPRNRHTRYCHGVFDRFSRRTGKLEEGILEAFALGMSTRGLSRWLAGAGVGLSAQGVSNVLSRVDASVRAWHRRSLAPGRWRYVIADGMWLRLGGSRRVVLLAIGVGDDLGAELIDYRVARGETLEGWRDFLTGLRLRGLEGVELFTGDGSGGLESALEWVYPGVARQLCVFHRLQGVASNLCEFSNRRAILGEASRIYSASTAEEAAGRARVWARRWRLAEGEAVRLFLEGFEDTLVYYRFPREAWRRERATNVAERYIRELRSRLKSIAA